MTKSFRAAPRFSSPVSPSASDRKNGAATREARVRRAAPPTRWDRSFAAIGSPSPKQRTRRATSRGDQESTARRLERSEASSSDGPSTMESLLFSAASCCAPASRRSASWPGGGASAAKVAQAPAAPAPAAGACLRSAGGTAGSAVCCREEDLEERGGDDDAEGERQEEEEEVKGEVGLVGWGPPAGAAAAAAEPATAAHGWERRPWPWPWPLLHLPPRPSLPSRRGRLRMSWPALQTWACSAPCWETLTPEPARSPPANWPM
mmetsp:Transcript_117319/g.332403  ORF Transcript_117319/g.332403 Transcript_117319/m.332403 type:complete len:263 (-) Transcript_117319:56-844(-)